MQLISYILVISCTIFHHKWNLIRIFLSASLKSLAHISEVYMYAVSWKIMKYYIFLFMLNLCTLNYILFTLECLQLDVEILNTLIS